MVSSPAVPNSTKKAEEDKKHRDCADVYQAGFHKNGVYTIYITPQETKKVRQSVRSGVVRSGAVRSMVVRSRVVRSGPGRSGPGLLS